jgi:serine/threonine protein phosphatase PrpC
MNNSELEKPATKIDIEDLRQEMLSKMTTMATKEELKKLATKQELKKFELATKEEFKKQNKKIDNLARVVGQMQHQMALFETKEDADRKFNILITAIDGLTKKVTDFQIEMRAGERTIQRHEAKLENHEQRIESLENHLIR